jgi:hypothetical protein
VLAGGMQDFAKVIGGKSELTEARKRPLLRKK